MISRGRLFSTASVVALGTGVTSRKIAPLLLLRAQVMHKSVVAITGSSMPEWLAALPAEVPNYVRIFVLDKLEANAKLLEANAKLLEVKDEANAKLLEVNDKLLEEVYKRLADKEAEVERTNQRRIEDLSKYQVVFELRGTFDFMLRMMYPKRNVSPGQLYKLLYELDLTVAAEGKDVGANRKLTRLAAETYADLETSFCKGPFQASFLEDVRNLYQTLNNRMHSSPNVHIADRKGLACGGTSRDEMFLHAFVVACCHKLCVQKNIPLEPELQRIMVLNEDYTQVHGVVDNGGYARP
jgi:hypothetical protein